MNFTFVKNIQFTKLIKVNGRLKEFNFRKSNRNLEGLFTVDVVDDRGGRIIFYMERSDDSWKITSLKLPDWVINNEKTYQELIEEEFNRGN
jgi:hypothetical protein